jgi:hypothetical protein
MTETASLSLRNRMQDLRDLQKFCLTYEHAIQYVDTPGSLYRVQRANYTSRRASTFIYTFFVFNNLYSIDWQTSLTSPDKEPDEADGSNQEQFWKMIAVCYQNTAFNAPSHYSQHLVDFCERFGFSNPLSKLKGIRSEQNTELENKLQKQYTERQKPGKGKELTMQSIANFKESFKALYRYGKGTAVSLVDHQLHLNNVLYFIYCVRCNVFHGDKGVAVAHIQRSQDERLLIYSAALLAANQLILDHAKQVL